MQFIINKHSIFVSNNGESYTLDSTYPSFDKIKDFIKVAGLKPRGLLILVMLLLNLVVVSLQYKEALLSSKTM